jgi:hypothetical protein
MKKIVSLALVVLMVFVLEFHLLRPLSGGAHIWIEPLLSFALIAALLVWNFGKRKSGS